MNLIHKKVSFRDRRGEIIDILEKEPVEYATLITSRKGSVRGNHYHKKSVQYTFVLEGKLKIFTAKPGKGKKSFIAKAKDLVFNAPNERHAILALESSKFLVLTRGPRGGKNYEKDTFRISEKLI